MDNTTEYNDFDIDQLNEETETELVTEHDETEEVENDSEELRKLRSENVKLVEIIKRRKEREAQAKPTQTQTISKPSNSITRDEAVLFAQGFSEEDVDYLNVVAKGTGLSLKEAKEHPIFSAYLEKLESEKRNKKASMGASKGSTIKKPVVMSGLSKEDHLKIWREKNGME